jgi:outer membrane protein assembly factor BamD
VPILLFIYSLLCMNLEAAPESLSVQEQYDLGQKYLKRGYYTKAIEQFNIIRNYYRDDPMAQMAELAIADVYFKKSEWDLARYSYDDFRRRYPKHEKVDYATYQIGLTFYKKSPRFAGRDQSWTVQAVYSWQNFEKYFPGSEYQQDVIEKRTECLERLAKKELIIAEFYERREAWDSVRRRSEGLVQAYPDSEYIPDAYELLFVSYWSLGDTEAAQLSLLRLQELDSNKAEVLQKKYLE